MSVGLLQDKEKWETVRPDVGIYETGAEGSRCTLEALPEVARELRMPLNPVEAVAEILKGCITMCSAVLTKGQKMAENRGIFHVQTTINKTTGVHRMRGGTILPWSQDL